VKEESYDLGAREKNGGLLDVNMNPGDEILVLLAFLQLF
jgi:hypothetical protein